MAAGYARVRLGRKRNLPEMFSSEADCGFVVLPDRIELSTSPLPRECSTTELRQHRRGWIADVPGRIRAGTARSLPQGRPWRNLLPEPPKARPAVTETPKDPQKERRAQRLSAALRDNLKRRKAQAKRRDLGRAAEKDGPAGPSTETHDSAGFGEDKRNR